MTYGTITLCNLNRDTTLVANVDVHRLDLGVVLQRVLAELTADTRLFETTEWDLGVQLVVAVDPDGTGENLGGEGMGTGEVLGKDGRGETIVGVVGGFEDFLFSLKRGHDDDGAKDFLADNLHVGGDVAEHSLYISTEHSIQRE